jgi:hypothetical protein
MSRRTPTFLLRAYDNTPDDLAFFTAAPGVASFTVAVNTSPMDA